MRTVSAYAYSAAGPGESTTDLAWDGQAMVHELGVLLAQSSRFGDDPEITYADIYVQRLRLERMRTGTFNDSAAAAEHTRSDALSVGKDSVRTCISRWSRYHI